MRGVARRRNYLWSVSPAPPPVLHLSLILGGALVDGNGDRLGRVEDLIVRLSESGYPPITGFLASVAGRRSFLPAELVSDVAPGHVVLPQAKLDLRPFERRPGRCSCARTCWIAS